MKLVRVVLALPEIKILSVYSFSGYKSSFLIITLSAITSLSNKSLLLLINYGYLFFLPVYIKFFGTFVKVGIETVYLLEVANVLGIYLMLAVTVGSFNITIFSGFLVEFSSIFF